MDEYQLVLSPQHGIAGRLSGFGELAYHGNDTNDSRSTVVGWPGLIYTTTTWLQFAGGLRSVYTENRSAADLIELRPFGGMKVQVRNRLKWHVLSDRFHPELIYQAQFAHPAGGGSREINSHVLQLHVKIGLQQGILREIRGMTLGR